MKSIWIARDGYGHLTMFKSKPKRHGDYPYWHSDLDHDYYPIDDDLFLEVTLENSPVELVIKEKENNK